MPRRGDRCVACQREFAAGEALHVCLYDTPTGYERRDFCGACPPPPEPQPVGVWKSRRPDSSAAGDRGALVIDRPALLAFLEQLAGAVDRRQVQFRFVLALLLWRKRSLKLEGTRDDAGVECWDFHDPRTGASHVVARPDLDESELERLSTELESLITGGTAGELLGGTPAQTEARP
jgi:hypothetical protein